MLVSANHLVAGQVDAGVRFPFLLDGDEPVPYMVGRLAASTGGLTINGS